MSPARGTWWGSGGDSGDQLTVGSAIRRFTVGIVATLAVLVVGSVVAGGHVARSAALDEGEFRARAIAENLAAPLVTARFRAGDPDAVADLDRLMTNRMRDGSLEHIKIWSEDGTVLWSDERKLVGRRFTLDAEASSALRSSDAVSDFSALDRAENVQERGDAGTLMEVYVGTVAADGQPMLFEGYFSTKGIAARQRAIVTTMVAVAVGSLLLFAMTVLPLSLALARRVQRTREDRQRMTSRALMSSELERRRIAQQLHDGVVQDLAGIGYLLPGLVSRLRAGRAEPADAGSLDRIQGLITSDIAELRSLMAEVYPPNLADVGLRRAVEDLVMDSAGEMFVAIEIEADLVLAEASGQLAYRVLREGLRNVLHHAEATRVELAAHVVGERLHVSVVDDGKGVAEGGIDAEEGHFGLRLLQDTVQDVGGSLKLVAHEPRGARLDVEFPADVLRD